MQLVKVEEQVLIMPGLYSSTCIEHQFPDSQLYSYSEASVIKECAIERNSIKQHNSTPAPAPLVFHLLQSARALEKEQTEQARLCEEH